MKVSELEGADLDYWVARALDLKKVKLETMQGFDAEFVNICTVDGEYYRPSTDWSQGGPLVPEFKIDLSPTLGGKFSAKSFIELGRPRFYANSCLVAICRAVVAAKFGDEAPEE